ncbi:MAG: Hint domain-containing protein [Neomegalonema sp.]|nr:Hint domain-containing protein [Neomegalonema sp.]
MTLSITELHYNELGGTADGGKEFIEVRADAVGTDAPFTVEVFNSAGTEYATLSSTDAVLTNVGDDGATYYVFTFDSTTSDSAGNQATGLQNNGAVYVEGADGGSEFISYGTLDAGFVTTMQAGSTAAAASLTTPTDIGVTETATETDSLQLQSDTSWAQEASTAGNQTDTPNPTPTDDALVCFCRGTMIETAEGEKAVEELKSGDLVRTVDGEFKPVAWIGSSKIAPRGLGGFHRSEDLPIRITAGALGNGMPKRDLTVSAKHGILVEGARVEMLFDLPRAFAYAGQLINGTSIAQVETTEVVEYFHVLMDRHEAIISEGVATESYRPHRDNFMSFNNAEMIEALSQFSLRERAELYRPCYPLLDEAQTRALAVNEIDWTGVAIAA